MNISFSTICPVNAKRFLDHDGYKYLSAAQKEFVLKYIGPSLVRVQDPAMYSKPSPEFYSHSLYLEFFCLSENPNYEDLLFSGSFQCSELLVSKALDHTKLKPNHSLASYAYSRENRQLIDLYLSHGFSQYQSAYCMWTAANEEFFLNNLDLLFNEKDKFSSFGVERFSAKTLTVLYEKKILTKVFIKRYNKIEYLKMEKELKRKKFIEKDRISYPWKYI